MYEAKQKTECKNKGSRWTHADFMKRAARLDVPALAELYLRWVPIIDGVLRSRGRRLTDGDARGIRERVLDDVCQRAIMFTSVDDLDSWVRRSSSRLASRMASAKLARRILFGAGGSGHSEQPLPSRPPCELEAWRFAREAKKRIDKRREAPKPPAKRFAAIPIGGSVAILALVIIVAANNRSTQRQTLGTFELIAEQGRPAQRLPVRKGQSLETGDGQGTVAVLGDNRIGLAPATKLKFANVSDDTLEVELERGSLAGLVGDEEKGRVLEVRSGRITVLAGNAKVAVKRLEDEVEVRVSRGEAEVLHDGLSLEAFRAPQIVRIGQTGRLTFVAADEKNLREVDVLLRRPPKTASAP